MTASDRWREQLGRWSIPEEIVASAPESPWGFPTELFRRRGEGVLVAPPTITSERALEALPAGGTVLDVGVGGGAMSLPLSRRAGLIVGVDTSAGMLEAFRANAISVGVEVRTVLGAWPDVAAEAGTADVAVAGHIAYNVEDLEGFARTLGAHARHRVLLELTERHPLSWMNDLWRRFHGLERPIGPTAEDALAVLTEIGIDAHREDRTVTALEGGGGFAKREDAIRMVRRRLCLRAERDPEIADQLGERLRRIDGLWDVGPPERTIVTLWWDTDAGASG